MSGNPLMSATPEQLAALPAATAPEGVKSNLENPHSDAPKLLITGAFLMTLMYVFAGMRFYMRIFVRKKIIADDWTTLVAVPYIVILAGRRLYVVTSPEGNHQLYRNTSTVSRGSFVKNMMLSVGISESGVSKMLASLPSHIDVEAANSVEASSQHHNRQLLPGSKEFEWLFFDKIIPQLNNALTLDYMENHLSGRDIVGEKIKLSLWNMCEKIFIRDTGDVFFGSGLWKENRDLFESFKTWERTNWKSLLGMPKI